MKNVEASVVRTAAHGNWENILKTLAPSIPEEAFSRLGRHTPCPVHGAGTSGDGFKLFKRDFHECGGGMCNTCGKFNDGFKLLQWINGWDFVTALVEVAGVLGIATKTDETAQRAANAKREIDRQNATAARLESEKANDTRIRARLNTIWSEAMPLTAPDAEPARQYLASRAILSFEREGLSASIRFHRSLASYNEDLQYEGHFPAIVAKVLDASGKAATIHRIYLTEDGKKAPVESCKKMFQVPSDRTIMGGGIITSAPAEVVDVCEGIETALAIETAMGFPVWPLVNATMLEGFTPQEGVTCVRIWVDHDRSGRGLEAGSILKKRLTDMGIKAAIVLPKMAIPEGEKGVDWNDVLQVKGSIGFPQRSSDVRRAA